MASRKSDPKSRSLSKGGLIRAVTDAAGDLSRRQVKAILDSLVQIGHRELKRQGTFTVPGFAKFRVVKRPATRAREGINPFTKERTVFAARPASKAVRARPIKAIKDAIT